MFTAGLKTNYLDNLAKRQTPDDKALVVATLATTSLAKGCCRSDATVERCVRAHGKEQHGVTYRHLTHDDEQLLARRRKVAIHDVAEVGELHTCILGIHTFHLRGVDVACMATSTSEVTVKDVTVVGDDTLHIAINLNLRHDKSPCW